MLGSRGFPGGSVVKNPPAGFDPWVSLEKEVATHSSGIALQDMQEKKALISR